MSRWWSGPICACSGGWRRTCSAGRAPARRGQQMSDTLRVACENYRYALLTGVQLFDLVRSAKQDPDDDNLRALRRAILTAEGPLPGDELAGAADSEPAEPARVGAGGAQASDDT